MQSAEMIMFRLFVQCYCYAFLTIHSLDWDPVLVLELIRSTSQIPQSTPTLLIDRTY